MRIVVFHSILFDVFKTGDASRRVNDGGSEVLKSRSAKMMPLATLRFLSIRFASVNHIEG